MSDPKAFAEKAIDQTCEDCNITRAQRKEYGMLLNVLRNDLEAAHPHIAAAATGKQMSQEEFTAAKEKSQQMHLEGMVKSGRETEAEIRDTVGRASEQAIKDKIVDTVVDKHNGGFFGWSAIKKDAVVITEHNKNPTAASEASPDLKRARDNVYLFARQDSTISYRTPSEIQVQKIAQVTGNAVAEATKSAAGKNFSKEEMANHVETTVRQHLKEQESEIDKLDTPIATLNQRIGVDSKTKKPTDLLDSVAKGVGDKVRNNEKLADGQGVYDRLTTAQKVLVEAKDAQMKMHASTANVKAPDVKHDKVDLPPNGHSVSAQPSQKVVATVAARTPGSH